MAKPQVPEEIQERFARAAARMVAKYDIAFDDISEFMMDIIQIYEDYIHEGKKG